MRRRRSFALALEGLEQKISLTTLTTTSTTTVLVAPTTPTEPPPPTGTGLPPVVYPTPTSPGPTTPA